MKAGDKLSYTRSFSQEDITLFARLSGDDGVHHHVPDEKGRLMAHGLLTATLPTKLGGDMNLIASEMLFQFHRPVYAGDTIECVVTLLEASPVDSYTRIDSEWRCTNQNGKVVMTGRGKGIIRDRAS